MKSRTRAAISSFQRIVRSYVAPLDKATFSESYQYPAGIPTVVVNGKIALRDGERVGKGKGKALRVGQGRV